MTFRGGYIFHGDSVRVHCSLEKDIPPCILSRGNWSGVHRVTGVQVVFDRPMTGAAAHGDPGQQDGGAVGGGGFYPAVDDHGGGGEHQLEAVFHIEASIVEEEVLGAGANING